MKKETLVHVRFDREESKEYKRDILHAQLDILRVTRALKNFKENRLKELDKKQAIYQELKEMRRKVKSLESSLPKPKIPKIVKESREEKEEPEKEEAVEEATEKPEKTPKTKPKDEIESELLEIQEKLRNLH